MNKAKIVLLWILKILAGIGFLLASLGKLTSNPQVIEMFDNWGYPNGFYLVTGVLELAGAILLFIPKTTFYAIIGLGIILIGATITHIIHDPIQEILRPIVFMLLLGGVAYLRKQ